LFFDFIHHQVSFDISDDIATTKKIEKINENVNGKLSSIILDF
jgi:hypothetical protein